jgi:pyruvate ferredoxin oxidoreductase gamma subunit
MSGILRIRFHGRGGQGMKTAGRVLGSAAFHAGYEVQDSPLYGAERRGAPMMAFVRIAREPILERGAIERPHLVVISDETLLDDPASSPLAGCGETTTVLLNTTRDSGSACARTIRHDLTELALRTTSSLVSLSTALGAAAACLAGIALESALRGVEDELSSLGAERLSRNLELAREVYAIGGGWPRIGRPVAEADVSREAALVELPLDPPRRAAPSIYASANTRQRRTGSWRQFRPVLEKDKCNRCWLCFVSCPEGAIALDDEDYPLVDLDVCKGCLLCVHECPTHAFEVERELRTTP